MNTFKKTVGRLQIELAVTRLTDLRKAMGINKTTFSSWKGRKSIPLGALVKCWLRLEMGFDLKYVLSGKRAWQPARPSLDKLKDELTNWQTRYDRLEKMYAQARYLLEINDGRARVDEIFGTETLPALDFQTGGGGEETENVSPDLPSSGEGMGKDAQPARSASGKGSDTLN